MVKQPSPGSHFVAVGQFGGGEIVAAVELDEGDVAHWIETDDDCVVQLAIGHAALHERAGGLGDVKIGERVTIGRNDHARAAPLPSRRKNAQHGGNGLGGGGDARLLGLQNGRIDFERRRWRFVGTCGQRATEHDRGGQKPRRICSAEIHFTILASARFK